MGLEIIEITSTQMMKEAKKRMKRMKINITTTKMMKVSK